MPRRIPQTPLTKREVRAARHQLAVKLKELHGIPIAKAWGPLGFMLNRATLPSVIHAVELSVNDPDPIAGAIERLSVSV